MFQVSKLSLTFGERQIFKDLSFSIADGEKVGLVGPNGAGKTTLLRILASELQPDRGMTRLGDDTICYVPQHLSLEHYDFDYDVLSFMLDGRGLNKIYKRIGEIEGLASNEDLIQEYLDLNEELIQKEGYRAENDVLDILCGLGLGNVDPSQRIATLSGGQKTKLVLGRMLFEQSDILLLDEPTNHIDNDSIEWLAGYIRTCPQTVLTVSHMPSFLDRVVSRILSFDDSDSGLRSYPGNYSHFLRIRQNEGLSQERRKVRLMSELNRQKRIVANVTQNEVGLKHSREKTVKGLEEQLASVKRISRKLKFTLTIRTPLHKFSLGADNIGKSFGSKPVLSGISFTLGSEERIGILGENGAGKTTLLRILAGQEKASIGRVLRNTHLEIGWYRQEQDDLEDQNTVLQEVENVRSLPTQNLRAALAHFNFTADRLQQRVGTLSRGERARLALCKIMLKGPNILLLDEPTNHLDRVSRNSLIEALNEYKGAIAVVSHDMDFIRRINVHYGLQMPSGRSVRV